MARSFKEFVRNIDPTVMLMAMAFRRAVYQNPDDLLVAYRLDRLIFEKRDFVSREKTLEDFKGVVKEFCRQNEIRISDLALEGEQRWTWCPDVGLVRKKGFKPVSECRFVKRIKKEDHARYDHWVYW